MKAQCNAHKMKADVRTLDIGGMLGLHGVVVENLPVRACESCDEVVISGALLRTITLHVARMMIVDVDQLSGTEIRFLRKLLREPREAFARRIGVESTVLAAWEGSTALRSPMESYAVRSLVAGELLRSRTVSQPLVLEPTATRPNHARVAEAPYKLPASLVAVPA